MNTITSKLESEHKAWLEEIRGLERELDEMSKVNGEIVSNAATKEDKKKVEHFENQFTIQKGRLDEMKHNIKLYGGDFDKGRKELEEYRSYYNQLKKDFESFSSEHL